jgi:hypothetical protein
VANQSRQADGAAINERYAEAPTEHPERRILGHHAQVTPAGQFQPAGHGEAFHGGNHRF